MKFLEYEQDSGRIVCETTAPAQPEAKDGRAFLEIGGDDNRDWSQWAVKGGELEKVRESAAERRIREAKKRKQKDEATRRMKEIRSELMDAILNQDGTGIKALRFEYKKLKDLL